MKQVIYLTGADQVDFIVSWVIQKRPYLRRTLIFAAEEAILADVRTQLTVPSNISTEFLTLSIDTIAKDLLDYIIQNQVKMLVIGLSRNISDNSQHFAHIENLLSTVPCDVFALDPIGLKPDQVKSIIVPMGVPFASFGLHEALRFAGKGQDVVPCLVGARFNIDSLEITRCELDLALEEVDFDIPEDAITPKVVLADSEIEGLRMICGDNDCLLFGTSTISIFPTLRDNIHTGSNVAICFIRQAKPTAEGLLSKVTIPVLSWLPTLRAKDRVALFDRIHTGARFNADFTIMIGLSSAIACIGLLKNSTAIVIGAMLVAPLMTPLIGSGLALIQGNLKLFRNSVRAMILGVLIGLLISIIITFFVPVDELPLTVIERGRPDIMDLFVALFSGIAAGYAFSRTTVAEAIVGVAVATALVPPLATVGIAIAHKRIFLAESAFILFITNLVAIILGAALAFRLLGVSSSSYTSQKKVWVRRTLLGLICFSVLLSAPLGYRLHKSIKTGQIRPIAFPLTTQVENVLRHCVSNEPGVQIVLAGRSGVEEGPDVGIILGTDTEISEQFITNMEQKIRHVRGEDAKIKIITLKNANITSNRTMEIQNFLTK
jgi:uncharacterized hydrophobic protein (TIGR00271 family)